MDGWHLAHEALLARGTAARKGAPDTFDGSGYVDALRRIRGQGRGDPSIWLPEFRRDIENAVAGSIEVTGAHRLVLTEGNYLLLDTEPWTHVRGLLDVCWTIDVPAESPEQMCATGHRGSLREHMRGSDDGGPSACSCDQSTREQW